MKKKEYRSVLDVLPDIEIIDLDKISIDQWESLKQSDSFSGSDSISDHRAGKNDVPPNNTGDFSPAWLSRINWHIVFGLAMLLIIFLIIWRIMNFGVHVNPDDYEGIMDLSENIDYMTPLTLPEGAENPADDGITTIVLFGNAPFADDRDSQDGLANMIAEMNDAVVYNCAVENSYLAATGSPLLYAPEDAFNFYWLLMACMGDVDVTYQKLFADPANQISEEDIEIYNYMRSIDFNTVDVIAVMYDASDYLAGHAMYEPERPTDISRFTGNLEAGIDLIQKKYPHIRIIVMSPPYAFAVDENGEYVSSETRQYGVGATLAAYVIFERDSAFDQNVTFVDHLYGTITEEVASDYLTDNLHLNLEGRKLIAQRFKYALEYFD